MNLLSKLFVDYCSLWFSVFLMDFTCIFVVFKGFKAPSLQTLKSALYNISCGSILSLV